MVLSFCQVDPILPVFLFDDLHIFGRFFIIIALVYHYIDKKLPYFGYCEQKVEKSSFYKDDQNRR